MAIKSLIFKTLVFAAVVCTSGTNNGKPAIAHLQQEKRPQMEDRYPGLSVSPSGQLMLNDSPFKGVGVNYFNAFIRTLDQGHTDDTSYLRGFRSEEHTSELQSRENLVCRLLLEKKKHAG